MLKDRFVSEYEIAVEAAECFGGRVYLYVPTKGRDADDCHFVFKKRHNDHMYTQGMLVKKLTCSEGSCWYGFIPVKKIKESETDTLFSGS